MAKQVPQVKEDTWFEKDPEAYDTPHAKNARLADLLTSTWQSLEIVSIRRLEIGIPGWEATYRPVPKK
ncbi:MAG: hypothetical protein IBJ18_07090 [Phycisphaerales bacterium]|nr:hypothetical protein [Phycisphaerales bacterium]